MTTAEAPGFCPGAFALGFDKKSWLMGWFDSGLEADD
jgi:hypothetical protein